MAGDLGSQEDERTEAHMKGTAMTYQRYLGPVMLGAAAVALLAALGLPVFAFLPFLVFLACPLMMVFMMRGMDHGGAGHAARHGGHGSHESHQLGDRPADTSTMHEVR